MMIRMMVRLKKIILTGMLLLLAFGTSGCRRRVNGHLPGADSGMDSAMEGTAVGWDNQRNAEISAKEGTETGTQSDPLAENEITSENPSSDRKEYDETADAEIRDNQAQRLQDQGDGTGYWPYASDALSAVVRIDGEAERRATQTSWVDHSDRQSATQTGETAESALQYYSVLLTERTRSLFECKKKYTYLEMPQAYVTVYKSSPAHQLLTDAGTYDVSIRLRENDLVVDSGWVVRKNPDVIVKLVETDVLGPEADGHGAEPICQALLLRPEWSEIRAVQDHCLILMSTAVLDDPYLMCAGALLLAKTVYPELLEDVDLQEAMTLLMDEAGSAVSSGTFFYVTQGGILL